MQSGFVSCYLKRRGAFFPSFLGKRVLGVVGVSGRPPLGLLCRRVGCMFHVSRACRACGGMSVSRQQSPILRVFSPRSPARASACAGPGRHFAQAPVRGPGSAACRRVLAPSGGAAAAAADGGMARSDPPAASMTRDPTRGTVSWPHSQQRCPPCSRSRPSWKGPTESVCCLRWFVDLFSGDGKG